MLRYQDYYQDERLDVCDECVQQSDYLVALSLTQACNQLGK